MSGIWIMAGITFREAARRKILWMALIAAALLLAIFGVALHLQIEEFNSRAMSPFVRYQVQSGMLMIGLYTADLLAVVMAILTSIDALAGEISSGTIHAIATKPVARWQILVGKFSGFIGMIAIYVALTFAGTIAAGYWIGGVTPQHAVRGALLVLLECILALSLTFMLGTWFSTLTNGVLVLGLQGVAFMGGWLEQVSGFSQSAHIVTLGVVSSLIMPGESLWRRAAYAAVYLAVALAVAIYHFQHRDL
jgi:Cu-processing system permease protein